MTEPARKPKDDAPKFSLSKKARAFALAAIFAGSAALPGAVGTPARATFNAVAEAPAMLYTTQTDDYVYISGKNMKFDARSDSWTIDATTAPDDGTMPGHIRFTVKSSLMHQLWSNVEKNTAFNPDRVVAPVASQEEALYRATYHAKPFAFIDGGKVQQAELLDLSKVPPKAPQSGIPFAWPPGMWDKAFSPF